MSRKLADGIFSRSLIWLAFAAIVLILISGCTQLFAPKLTHDAFAPTPTVCSPLEHTVSAQADVRNVQVGDTFTVTVNSTDFAGLTTEHLFVSYRLASVPELEINAVPAPLVEVLPTSQGSTIGSATFDLRAIQPGSLYLYAEIYGDAYFYSPGSCIPGTTFMAVRSVPIHVTIWALC